MSRNLHLGLSLDGAGWHPRAWTERGAKAAELLSARYWIDQVAESRSGLLDFVTIEDGYRLRGGAASTPHSVPDPVRGRLDAVMLAARIAPVVPHIGLLPAASTALTEPFLLSTQIATLDFISAGRAGWLAQIDSRPEDAGYVGPRAVADRESVPTEAAEHVEVVRRLWDSWEDGAEIRDADTNRFFDRDRVHYVDFEGAHFSVKGPSITPRAPQGQPLVAILTRGGPKTEVAVAGADIVLVGADECALPAAMRQIENARHAADAAARSDQRVLAELVVFLDADQGRAVERRARLDEAALAPDEEPALDPRAQLVFAGTPAELVERLAAWRELGLDGFRLHPGVIPHDLQAITRQLVPALQRSGAFRLEYEARSLRGLLGLRRPTSRYAERARPETVLR